MISLKRNSKGELVPATGLRTKPSSIYTPNQVKEFKISRSKFSDFLKCKRCFYFDRVQGLVSPSTPGWTLNQATDLLLKKEFDECREKQVPHRIFKQFGLDDVVPFRHKDLDLWREPLHHGLQHQVENSNLVLHGGIDDVWVDLNNQQLIIVDYKSQSSSKPVTKETYLFGAYKQEYKIQLDFYAYLLVKMGFSVSPIGYFYVCNADRSVDQFNGRLLFEETIIPYRWSIDWLEQQISLMTNVLNSDHFPDGNPACENCAYAMQRTRIES